MIRLPFVLYFILLCSLSYAQPVISNDLIKEKSKPFHVTLVPEKSDLDEIQLKSVSQFEILDYRPDSVRIGFFKETGNSPYEILLKNSSPAQLGAALENALASPNGTRSLTVVIRRLWLSDIILPLQTASISHKDAALSRVSFRAEIYLKEKELFIPLVSFDTLITSNKPTRIIAPFRTPKLFTYLLNKLKITDINALASSRRKISYAEMDAFSRRSFLYSADTVSTPKKGVYANITEFKNNTPSITEYELQQEPGSPMSIYLKDADGKPYLSRKLWGVSDGKNLFIQMGGYLYPAIRSCHSFYLYGSQVSFVQKNSAAQFLIMPALTAAGALPGKSTPVTKTAFFAVDMETGEIY